MAADLYSILPLDCWELIFNRVDNLEAMSLVCKDFLSISNRFRHELKVYSSSIELLIRLLKRFRYLKKIDLSVFHGDINQGLQEIARSGLNLESLNISSKHNFLVESLKELGSTMKGLKTLECSNLFKLKDSDLIAIASSLPFLEEIDISRWLNKGLTEVGIERLAKGCPNLQQINISVIEVKPERMLLALSSKYPFLKKIKVRSYYDTNEDCIGQLFRHCHNLVSLSVSRILLNPSKSNLAIENSISFAKNLYELEFFEQFVPDDILCAIAKSHIPLKKFRLKRCRGYSISGLLMCLNAHQSLEELNLQRYDSIKDKDISTLSKYLQNITVINLRSCRLLTGSTFFNLLKNCPSLVEIDMADTNLGKNYEEDLSTDLCINYNVRNLRLSQNRSLKNYMLKQIVHSCPNLQQLDMRYCSNITSNGIREVLKCCNQIKHLKVHTKISRADLQLFESGMEVLEIARVDDDDMNIIAKRCCGLRELKVKYSDALTNKGVVVVVEKCVKLRRLKLKQCDQVNVDNLPLTRVGSFRVSLWKTTFV